MNVCRINVNFHVKLPHHMNIYISTYPSVDPSIGLLVFSQLLSQKKMNLQRFLTTQTNLKLIVTMLALRYVYMYIDLCIYMHIYARIHHDDLSPLTYHDIMILRSIIFYRDVFRINGSPYLEQSVTTHIIFNFDIWINASEKFQLLLATYIGMKCCLYVYIYMYHWDEIYTYVCVFVYFHVLYVYSRILQIPEKNTNKTMNN